MKSTCIICGQAFQKKTANAQVCNDVCRRERDNRKKRKVNGPLPGKNFCTCVACGKKFAGRLPNHPYKCCGSEKCRDQIRRMGGKASAKTVTAKKKTITVLCLGGCGKLWKSPSKFIRVCPRCKAARAGQTHSEAYGGSI